MKFDYIIGNPPYQENDGGAGASAKPVYHKFIDAVNQLDYNAMSLIIPARWYAGGKGLDTFRKDMLENDNLKCLVDYPNSADCFPNVNVAGGICYFLKDVNYHGDCKIVNCKNGKEVSEMTRPLNEFKYFVRDNLALSIIRKVMKLNEQSMDKTVFQRNYFGIPTTIKESTSPHEKILCLTSKGVIQIEKKRITDKLSLLGKYKVIITYAMSGGNKPTSNGNYQIISSLKILKPQEACSETYLILDYFDDKIAAQNLVSYIKTKFARFLLLQALTSIHITRDKFCFVPVQDYSQEWDDKQLYKKYNLSSNEIELIEKTIKEME